MSFFEEKQWDILGKRTYFYVFSLIVIAIGLFSWIIKGLNFGIDFTGGTLYVFQTTESLVKDPVKVSGEVTEILDQLGINASAPQVYGRDQLLVRTQTKSDAEAKTQGQQLLDALKETGKFGEVQLAGQELVEPIIGKYLQMMALKALVIGCLLILIYIAIRYEFDFAVAGVVALVHDVLVMVGYFALFQVEVDSGFVAAILTIVGYSINDTVIVFDRIRENLKLRRGESFERLANLSILQTLRRSIMTSVTVIVVLVFLFGFGGASIRHFALAMLVGIVSGTYSTVSMGASLVVSWRKITGRLSATTLQGLRSSQSRRQPSGRPQPQTSERPSRTARSQRAARGNQPLVPTPAPETAAPTPAPEESEPTPEGIRETTDTEAIPAKPRSRPKGRKGKGKGKGSRKKKRRF